MQTFNNKKTAKQRLDRSHNYLKCILQICLTINFIHLLTEVEGNIGDV